MPSTKATPKAEETGLRILDEAAAGAELVRQEVPELILVVAALGRGGHAVCKTALQ